MPIPFYHRLSGYVDPLLLVQGDVLIVFVGLSVALLL